MTQPQRRLEVFVGNLLRVGVLTAAAVVLAGGTIYLWRHGLAQRQYKNFLGEPADLRSVVALSATFSSAAAAA
jgi:hypothetical protein